jgi:hypothetical protein
MDISREGTYYLKLGLFKPGCNRVMPEEYPVAMNVTFNGRIISEAKSWEKIFGGTEDDGG